MIVRPARPCYSRSVNRSLVVAFSILLVACGDDTGSGGSGAGGGAGGDPTGGAPMGGQSEGGGGASGGAAPGGGGVGGGVGGGACVDTSGLTYGPGPTGEPGCLDAASATAFCGFGSDEAICNFSVGCGVSRDLGQCQINCEQGSASFCNDEAAVQCVVDAYCADDCTALDACTFIL